MKQIRAHINSVMWWSYPHPPGTCTRFYIIDCLRTLREAVLSLTLSAAYKIKVRPSCSFCLWFRNAWILCGFKISLSSCSFRVRSLFAWKMVISLLLYTKPIFCSELWWTFQHSTNSLVPFLHSHKSILYAAIYTWFSKTLLLVNPFSNECLRLLVILSMVCKRPFIEVFA